jgi:hypothetical protein
MQPEHTRPVPAVGHAVDPVKKMELDPAADAVVRLEKWLLGAPDFMLEADVRLVLNALREADDIRFEMLKLEQKHARLRDDVDELERRLRGVA